MSTEDVLRWLGGKEAVQREAYSDLELVQIVEEGLPTEVVDDVLARGKLLPREVYRIIIPRRTLSHRKQKQERLTRDESDKMARVARVMTLAEETFQSPEKAQAWMRRPNRALAGEQPIDMLETEQGARMVETVLVRIAHGVFS